MKKLNLIFLGLILTLPLFSSCTFTSEDSSDYQLIEDMLGRKVKVRENVERILPLGNTPRMLTYLGLEDKFVGIEKCEVVTNPLQAYAYIHYEEWKELPICGTNSMGETAYYPEQIIMANPDVIFSTDTGEVADNLQKQTGIPVVCVSSSTLFGQDYEQALNLIGQVCAVSDKALALNEYINSNLNDISNRVKNVSEEDKPLVLAAGATFKGSHSIDGIYTNYPVFKILEVKDAAKDVPGQIGSSGVMVDKEQILSWNPDIIFFDAGSMDLVRNDYGNNTSYFNQLKAVKEGKLYQWPNSTWHWSNVEISLVSTYFVGKLLYPQAFEDISIENKAEEIFKTFIGVGDYLSILDTAGLGFAQVSLGE